ncbi:KH homology domain-containing protein 4-like isoform X4 [Mytilus trossulus]|uniref:KH homology domain-containing protein 4-like isoform X4 n=1 Tax=Mytilus trossulus TaxID=6551 RepID=UPI003007A1E1
MSYWLISANLNMPQPMNANNGEAPLIEIAPEEIVQVHQPPNNENQAPEPLVPEPAPEPVQQIPEQQQAPAHLIQAIQPTGTVPAQSHAAVPAQSPFQNQSNQQGHLGRSKMPPPYMYTPVQQQSAVSATNAVSPTNEAATEQLSEQRTKLCE